jgi:hypothetical protein
LPRNGNETDYFKSPTTSVIVFKAPNSGLMKPVSISEKCKKLKTESVMQIAK